MWLTATLVQISSSFSWSPSWPSTLIESSNTRIIRPAWARKRALACRWSNGLVFSFTAQFAFYLRATLPGAHREMETYPRRTESDWRKLSVWQLQSLLGSPREFPRSSWSLPTHRCSCFRLKFSSAAALQMVASILGFRLQRNCVILPLL